MGQWQNFDKPAVDDFIDNCLADQSSQSIEDCLGPRRHLLAFTAWQVSKLLSPDGIERTEDDYLLMKALLHHSFKSGTESKR